MLKTYELMARHFGWDDKPPKPASASETQPICSTARLRAQGVVSLDSICHLDAPSKAAIRRLIEARVRARRTGAGRARRRRQAGALGAHLRRWRPQATAASELVHILSPFDPLIIQRKRTELFFGYEHRFEAYVPKEKRLFGYFALPVLVGDDIVAAHRSQDRSQGRRIAGAEMELGRRAAGRGARKESKAPDRGRTAPLRAVSAGIMTTRRPPGASIRMRFPARNRAAGSRRHGRRAWRARWPGPFRCRRCRAAS